MARRLLGAGFSLAVYNRDRTKATPLASGGARIAGTPRDAAKGADIIVSMVADDLASRAMWLGSDGAIAGASRGALLVECSTVTSAWVKELAGAAGAVGLELVDAPVTGSKGAAAAGELNFLVGGSEASLERARPALMAMGRTITHFGPTGSGATVKLINNFLAGVHVAAFAEALAWLERSGIDRAKSVAFLLEGAAASPVTKIVATRMLAEDFAPNFLLRLMAKDLGYAIDEAAQKNVALATATTALGRFGEAIAAGHAEKDMAAIVLPLRARAGSPR
jgi:3-hydroxyisobutyrate dehydrogenase